jgi:hypothetical protein
MPGLSKIQLLGVGVLQTPPVGDDNIFESPAKKLPTR